MGIAVGLGGDVYIGSGYLGTSLLSMTFLLPILEIESLLGLV